jgi:hypothetical protein
MYQNKRYGSFILIVVLAFLGNACGVDPGIDNLPVDSGSGGTGGNNVGGAGGSGGSAGSSGGRIFTRDWVYRSVGSRLCANPAFMNDAPKAELMVWEGDPAGSGITDIGENGYCWEFSGRTSGARRFWYRYPAGGDTGAAYGSRSVVESLSSDGKPWMWCKFDGCNKGPNGTNIAPCGCDGRGDYTGSSWRAAGNM